MIWKELHLDYIFCVVFRNSREVPVMDWQHKVIRSWKTKTPKKWKPYCIFERVEITKSEIMIFLVIESNEMKNKCTRCYSMWMHDLIYIMTRHVHIYILLVARLVCVQNSTSSGQISVCSAWYICRYPASDKISG